MMEDEWIDKTMKSLEGIERAEPGPFLFTRIAARLNAAAGVRVVRPLALGLSGLSLALLILFNLVTLNRSTNNTDRSSKNHQVAASSSTYQLNPEHFELY